MCCFTLSFFPSLFQSFSHTVLSNRVWGEGTGCVSVSSTMHLQHLYRYVARWYQRVISQDGTLQRRQLRERALLFKITLVMSVLSCLVAIPMFTDADEKVIHLTSVTMFLSSGLFVLYRLTTLRSISKTMLCCIVVVLTVGLMCADLANRPRYNTDWPMFVIIIDMALVLRLPRSVSIGVTCLVVFWISLTQLEAFFRFGLFDLPGMSSQSHRREYVTDMMECETLPCPQEDAVPVVTSGLTMIFVFVADFVCTRGFAEGLKREQETMERTVGTVEEIALLLAGYDVDRVAQILSAKRDELSPEIFVALQTIERNLRSYLAYLPKTCLPTQDIEEDVEELGATATMCDDSVLGSVCEDVAQSVVGSSVSLGSPPMDAFSPTMFHAQSRANNHSFTHPSTMLKLHERSSTTRPAVGLLTPVKATVLIVNTCQHESLFHVENDTQNFARFFGQILQATLAAVGEKRGMVDVFVGDVVFCSFNASRRCGLHATAALCAAKAIANVPRTKPLSPASRQDDRVVSIGVAGGKAICGDLGCAEMRPLQCSRARRCRGCRSRACRTHPRPQRPLQRAGPTRHRMPPPPPPRPPTCPRQTRQWRKPCRTSRGGWCRRWLLCLRSVARCGWRRRQRWWCSRSRSCRRRDRPGVALRDAGHNGPHELQRRCQSLPRGRKLGSCHAEGSRRRC